MKAEIKFDRSEFKSEEKMIGGVEFTVKVGFTGNVYINGKYYRQLCFTPNQVALVVEDFLNGVPADEYSETFSDFCIRKGYIEEGGETNE